MIMMSLRSPYILNFLQSIVIVVGSENLSSVYAELGYKAHMSCMSFLKNDKFLNMPIHGEPIPHL
jgi:hypothetical protein